MYNLYLYIRRQKRPDKKEKLYLIQIKMFVSAADTFFPYRALIPKMDRLRGFV